MINNFIEDLLIKYYTLIIYYLQKKEHAKNTNKTLINMIKQFIDGSIFCSACKIQKYQNPN